MSWVLQGFSRATERIAEDIDLSDLVSEDEILTVLGKSERSGLGAWPVPPELMRLVESTSGRTLAHHEHEYFVEYQADQPPE